MTLTQTRDRCQWWCLRTERLPCRTSCERRAATTPGMETCTEQPWSSYRDKKKQNQQTHPWSIKVLMRSRGSILFREMCRSIAFWPPPDQNTQKNWWKHYLPVHISQIKQENIGRKNWNTEFDFWDDRRQIVDDFVHFIVVLLKQFWFSLSHSRLMKVSDLKIYQ